jgi:putative NIF3 family GTP cyclohydrolase 1 type 2
MTDKLVREAAMHNVDLYITGQFRQPARKAVQETHMNVAIIGHDVGEQWGLRALSALLQAQWEHIEAVIVASSGST